MPNTIEQNLQAILDATYGEEVRGAIHDSIAQCYDDVTEGVTKADRAASDAQAVVTQAQDAISEASQATAAAQEVVASAQNLVENLADEYDATKPYSVGQYCIHEYVLYRCTTEIDAGEEWEPSHWERSSVDGELNLFAEREDARSTKIENRLYLNLENQNEIPYFCFDQDYNQDFYGISFQKIGATFVLNGLINSTTVRGCPIYVYDGDQSKGVSGGVSRYSPIEEHTNSKFVLQGGHTYDIGVRFLSGKISSNRTDIRHIYVLFVTYDTEQESAAKTTLADVAIPASVVDLDVSTLSPGKITVSCASNITCGLIFYDAGRIVYDNFAFAITVKDITDVKSVSERLNEIESAFATEGEGWED